MRARARGFRGVAGEDIAVRIGKEGKGVPMGGLRIGKKTHTVPLEAGVDFGEIGDVRARWRKPAGFKPAAGAVSGADSMISIMEPSAALMKTVLLEAGW